MEKSKDRINGDKSNSLYCSENSPNERLISNFIADYQFIEFLINPLYRASGSLKN